jgi:hypothetical protein
VLKTVNPSAFACSPVGQLTVCPIRSLGGTVNRDARAQLDVVKAKTPIKQVSNRFMVYYWYVVEIEAIV